MNCTYNYESGQVPYFRRKTRCTAGHSFFVVVIFFFKYTPIFKEKKERSPSLVSFKRAGGKDLSVQFILDKVATRCEEKVLGLAELGRKHCRTSVRAS